jgi:hypothetical protein
VCDALHWFASSSINAGKYVYEPWVAPQTIQVAVGCVLGRDYPKRTVVHDTIMKTNFDRMAAAYEEHKRLKAAAGANEEEDDDDDDVVGGNPFAPRSKAKVAKRKGDPVAAVGKRKASA